jgi:hypothetical protein
MATGSRIGTINVGVRDDGSFDYRISPAGGVAAKGGLANAASTTGAPAA